MAASKSRKANAMPPEPTARPKPISEELKGTAFTEEGLSVDPEDLGAQFLVGATEQSNFESMRPAELSELSIVSAPPSDEPLIGPSMDADDHSLWEQTVDLTLQGGTREPPSLESAALDDGEEGEEGQEREQEEDTAGPRPVDLLAPVIEEASLFDREGDEPGETDIPEVPTDEGSRKQQPPSDDDS
jgi:hypothetical protein